MNFQIMKLFSITLLLLLCACSSNSSERSAQQEPTITETPAIRSTPAPIESVKPTTDPGHLNEMKSEMEDYLSGIHFSGAVLTADEDTIILKMGFGSADQKLMLDNEDDSIFRIASLTKQFTAAAILQLEEAGLLSLEDPLQMYFPEYTTWSKVTIHELLSQTSGIARETQNVLSTPMNDILAINERRSLKQGHPFQYSNINYILLSRIIEQVSKLSYEDYIHRNLFQPANMIDSGVSELNDKDGKQSLGESNSHTDYNSAVKYEGAGSIFSTALDLFRWNEALYSHTVLTEDSTARMFTSYSNRGYGYGWYVNQKSAYHLGNIDGYGAIITKSLNDQSVIIVLSNSELRRAQTIPISNKLADIMGRDDMIIAH